ncbi:MAG: lipocalin-like domain-containing protein [bacterium]
MAPVPVRWLSVPIILVLTTLSGCDKPVTSPGVLNLTDILAGEETTGFKRADSIRQFRFPADHGIHAEYRNEWWYFTGNLMTSDNRHFGYQVTFFRPALTPMSSSAGSSEPTSQPAPGPASEMESTWAVRDIWMAHVALTDIEAQQHHAEQRFSRRGPGLAGVTADPIHIWLDDWQVVGLNEAAGHESFPWQLNINTDQFNLELRLTPTKKPVLQGNQGLSEKSAVAGNASYYYSYSRLATQGQLTLGHSTEKNTYQVTGNSWFDREWSTSSLDAGQSGWDWFSLQFDTGEDLMYYQLLDSTGKADENSQGSWISLSGEKTAIDEQEMRLTVLKTWRASDGQSYPVSWRMDYLGGDQSWIIEAAVADQFMDLAVRYWEGAVEIYDPRSMKLQGRGYLEMTRINVPIDR